MSRATMKSSLPGFALFLLAVAAPALAWATGHGSGEGMPAVAGIRLEFLFFGLTLLGVAVFHHHTLRVALTGLTVIVSYKLIFDPHFHLFEHFFGANGYLEQIVNKHARQGEWTILLNLFGLLVGFAVLAKHFEESRVPEWLPKYLPDGWKGPLEGLICPLDVETTRGILPRGGTILGSSRTNPLKVDGGVDRITARLAELEVHAIIAIGGEDTLGVAAALHEAGVRVVGVPKTIDNDLDLTDYTFGFDTAVQIASDAIDRLHTTAESHHRVLVLEVMGRHAGWIALHSGMAGGANIILIPEEPFDPDEVAGWIESRMQRGYAPIVVVAEGATPRGGTMVTSDSSTDSFGHVRLSGVGQWLAHEMEQKTGYEARTTVLGYVQRGGTPTARDRVLATRFGSRAVRAVHEGESGRMVALQGTELTMVAISDAVARLKTVPPELYAEAKAMFG